MRWVRAGSSEAIRGLLDDRGAAGLRDLALFTTAIDSMLHGQDLLKVQSRNGSVRSVIEVAQSRRVPPVRCAPVAVRSPRENVDNALQRAMPFAAKGQIVFVDNVSTHRVDGVEEGIEARGARPIFLPAYSPDLNPIEQLFARLKSFLRKMKARTVEQLWRAIASFLKGVSEEECKAFLANSGYT
jgi:transposase